MSEHKTGKSNWTEEDKQLYWERRSKTVAVQRPGGRIYQKPLRGQIGYANVYVTVKDEVGNDQRVPLGYRRPSKGSISHGRH